ncbi:hypothetical protein [Pinirhizobacter sp.]|jgi:hypothetical protein|uniref:hypothetical protein n=1 Tax=Pinirhizobacter sp. TaxID=2950432 RepID=UPI002F40B18D
MRREVLVASVAMVVAVCLVGRAFADVTPEDEYKKKIRVSEEISPLGEHPFGERITSSSIQMDGVRFAPYMVVGSQ